MVSVCLYTKTGKYLGEAEASKAVAVPLLQELHDTSGPHEVLVKLGKESPKRFRFHPEKLKQMQKQKGSGFLQDLAGMFTNAVGKAAERVVPKLVDKAVDHSVNYLTNKTKKYFSGNGLDNQEGDGLEDLFSAMWGKYQPTEKETKAALRKIDQMIPEEYKEKIDQMIPVLGRPGFGGPTLAGDGWSRPEFQKKWMAENKIKSSKTLWGKKKVPETRKKFIDSWHEEKEKGRSSDYWLDTPKRTRTPSQWHAFLKEYSAKNQERILKEVLADFGTSLEDYRADQDQVKKFKKVRVANRPESVRKTGIELLEINREVFKRINQGAKEKYRAPTNGKLKPVTDTTQAVNDVEKPVNEVKKKKKAPKPIPVSDRVLRVAKRRTVMEVD